MEPEENLGWLIDRAIAWERMARDLYASLADASASHVGIAGFWQRMSNDESHHAEVCRSIKAAMPLGQLSRSLGQDERQHVRSIDTLWACVRTEQIKTLDDAYELAHELEASEINSVFRLVALGFYQDQASRDTLTSELDEHIDKLAEFGRWYDRESRRRMVPEGVAKLPD